MNTHQPSIKGRVLTTQSYQNSETLCNQLKLIQPASWKNRWGQSNLIAWGIYSRWKLIWGRLKTGRYWQGRIAKNQRGINTCILINRQESGKSSEQTTQTCQAEISIQLRKSNQIMLAKPNTRALKSTATKVCQERAELSNRFQRKLTLPSSPKSTMVRKVSKCHKSN